jgi:hypothetical protein
VLARTGVAMQTPLRIATSCLALGLLLAAPSSDAQAQIVVSPKAPSTFIPTTGPDANGRLFASATVSSPFAITEVTVTGNGLPINMVFGCYFSPPIGCQDAWASNVLIGFYGLTPGANELVYHATDVFGNTGSASTTIQYLPPPNLTVVEPADKAVATPLLDVFAICQDVVFQPCSSFSVRIENGPTLLNVAGSLLDHVVDLSAYDRTKVSLEIVGVGTTGTPRVIARDIYVESDPRWDEVDRVPGVIEAANDELVIYRQPEEVVRVLDRVTRVDDELDVIPNPVALMDEAIVAGPVGFVLIDGGTGWLSQCGGPQDCVFAYESGVLSHIAGAVSIGGAGRYALWTSGTALSRFDAETGDTIVVASDPTSVYGDVATNGDVAVKTSNGQISRYRNGVLEPLIVSGENQRPLTDGIDVAYEKYLPGTGYELRLHTAAGGDVMLAPVMPGYLSFETKLHNGFAGFNRHAGNNILQVWRRDPGGTPTQLTFYAPGAAIRSIGPNGEIIFSTSTFSGRLCLAEAGSGPVQICDDVGSSAGTPFYIGEQLHMALGGSLFVVNVPEPDGWLLRFAGLAGVALLAQRRRRTSLG